MPTSTGSIQAPAPALIDRYLSRRVTVGHSLSDINITLGSDQCSEVASPIVTLEWSGCNWAIERGYPDLETLIETMSEDEKEVRSSGCIDMYGSTNGILQSPLGSMIV